MPKPKSKNEPTQAWLCLQFIALALNSTSHRLNSNSPIAITEQQLIYKTNSAAQKLGVSIGQSISQAMLLCHHIHLIERLPNLESALLLELSDWAYRFTPHVHIHDQHTLFLEVGRSLSLFKSTDHLKHLIQHGLESKQVDVHMGFAATPKAAHLLSFSNQITPWDLASAKKKLRNAPLALLSLADKTIHQLEQCGFKVLGDILAIPNAELGQRFGKALTLYLDQLLGNIADPKEFIIPPEIFHRSLDFAQPIKNKLWIDQQLERLLQELLTFLTERELICQSFTWRFYHENNRLLKAVAVNLSCAKATLAIFKNLTDLKLANSTLDQAFSSIELRSESFVSKTLFNNDLFNPKPDQEPFHQLIEKLSNRLGQEAIYKVVAESEHLPELINIRYPNKQAPTPSQTSQEARAAYTTQEIKDEPLWLLKKAKIIGNITHQQLQTKQIGLVHGPHRIKSHWWRGLQSRDYYIARKKNGQLIWVYYEHQQQRWYQHGIFA